MQVLVHYNISLQGLTTTIVVFMYVFQTGMVQSCTIGIEITLHYSL